MFHVEHKKIGEQLAIAHQYNLDMKNSNISFFNMKLIKNKLRGW